MHVLFITDSRFDKLPSGDGSTRYRCFNVAEALIASGHRATVASLSEVMLDFIGGYDLISVLRPRVSAGLRKLVRAAKRQSIPLVADFDDLIFDISAAAESPLVLNGYADEKTVCRGFQKFAAACEWFDEFTVSTQPLAEAVERCFPGKPVSVVANGLSPLWLSYADSNLNTGSACEEGKESCISYLPGTRSHDADFRLIQPALTQWLALDATHRLRIVGELGVDDSVAATRQLLWEPLVPFFRLPEKIVNAGVTLAPLIGSRFNRAKSHIKFLESAAFGVPVVATPNADIEQHRSIAGLYCPDSSDDWLAAVTLAISQKDDEGIGAGLRDYVRNRWTSIETTRQLLTRWVRMAKKTSSEVSSPYLDDPDKFFLSLRPVPRYYTLKGWRPDQPTVLIVCESDSLVDFETLNQHWLKQRMDAIGTASFQWLVLVQQDAGNRLRRAWCENLRQWCSSASHIEVIHAASEADHCSLVYQCDHTLWLTPPASLSHVTNNRTITRLEAVRISADRWRRKARKFRESPGRFFADSQIVRLVRS